MDNGFRMPSDARRSSSSASETAARLNRIEFAREFASSSVNTLSSRLNYPFGGVNRTLDGDRDGDRDEDRIPFSVVPSLSHRDVIDRPSSDEDGSAREDESIGLRSFPSRTNETARWLRGRLSNAFRIRKFLPVTLIIRCVVTRAGIRQSV